MELVDLLPRLRQTLPLPLAPEEVYMGAFPAQIGKWFVERVPTDTTQRSVAYRNLMRVVDRGEVVHFNLADPPDVDDWVDTITDGMPFWIRMEGYPVCPSSRSMGFLLHDDVRNNSALLNWYVAAGRMDGEISEFSQIIYQIAPMFSSRSDLYLAWPEVVNAVPKIAGGLRISQTALLSRQGPRIAGIRKNIDRVLPPDKMARLLEMLAAALMLPKNEPLNAWVGINKEGLP